MGIQDDKRDVLAIRIPIENPQPIENPLSQGIFNLQISNEVEEKRESKLGPSSKHTFCQPSLLPSQASHSNKEDGHMKYQGLCEGMVSIKYIVFN